VYTNQKKGNNKLKAKNPSTVAIKHLGNTISNLEWDSYKFLPSLITSLVLMSVIAIFILLWPYGVLVMTYQILGLLIKDLWEKRYESQDYLEALPYTIAAIIIALIWGASPILTSNSAG